MALPARTDTAPARVNSEMLTMSQSDDEMILVRKRDVMELMEIIRRFTDNMDSDTWAAIYGAAISLVPPDPELVSEPAEEVEFSLYAVAQSETVSLDTVAPKKAKSAAKPT